MKFLGSSAAAAAAAALFISGAAEAQRADAGLTTPAPKSEQHGRQSGFFAGVGVGSYAYESPDLGTYGSGGIEVRAGYNFNKYLSVSGSAMVPTSHYKDESYNFTIATIGKVKSAYGVFVEPRLPLGDVFGLFARVGYVSAKLEDVPERRPMGNYALIDHDNSGLALGAGIDFDIGRHVTVALDLTTYNADLKAAGAGLMAKARF